MEPLLTDVRSAFNQVETCFSFDTAHQLTVKYIHVPIIIFVHFLLCSGDLGTGVSLYQLECLSSPCLVSLLPHVIQQALDESVSDTVMITHKIIIKSRNSILSIFNLCCESFEKKTCECSRYFQVHVSCPNLTPAFNRKYGLN